MPREIRSPHREQRCVPAGEVRFTNPDNPRQFSAVVLRYGVVDSYRTVFAPGVFTESMTQRMPRIVWAHDWTDPIGRWIGAEDTGSELILHGELDDFDAVPRARQAAAQLESGTIDQFSVGFVRQEDRDASDEYGSGVVEITRGLLDEASLVLVGAVPGTRPVTVPMPAGRSRGLALSVRSAGVVEGGTLVVALDDVVEVVLGMKAGDLDLADGLSRLKQLATVNVTADLDEEPSDVPGEAPDSPVDGPVDTDDLTPVDADSDASAAVEAAQDDTGVDQVADTPGEGTDDDLLAEADEVLNLLGGAA